MDYRNPQLGGGCGDTAEGDTVRGVRKTPIPAQEKEIGARLREARQRTGLSLVLMAKRVGIEQGRLASYEHGRAPTPYFVAAKIAEETDTFQRWLAVGRLPKKPVLEVHEWVHEMIPKTMAFSTAYKRIFEWEIEERLRSLEQIYEVSAEHLGTEVFTWVDPIGTHPSTSLRGLRRQRFDLFMALATHLPGDLQDSLAEELGGLGAKYMRLSKSRGRRDPVAPENAAAEEAEHREMEAIFKHKLTGE